MSMDPIDLDHRGQLGLHDMEPGLIELLNTVTDCAELAVLAIAVPDTLSLWGLDSPGLHIRFREAVRDQYRDLIQAQLTTGR